MPLYRLVKIRKSRRLRCVYGGACFVSGRIAQSPLASVPPAARKRPGLTDRIAREPLRPAPGIRRGDRLAVCPAMLCKNTSALRSAASRHRAGRGANVIAKGKGMHYNRGKGACALAAPTAAFVGPCASDDEKNNINAKERLYDSSTTRFLF